MSIEALLKNKSAPAPTALPTDFIDEVVAMMVSSNRNAVAIVEKETKLCGIITDHDIIRAVHETQNKGQSIQNMHASDWMTEKVITCDASARLNEALNLMGRNKIRHLAVVKDGELQGIVSIRDILSKMHDDDMLEANVLRDMAVASRLSQ